MRKILISIALALSVSGCHRTPCPKAAVVTKTQLFVFAGQSNMTGFPPYNVQVSRDPRIQYINDPMNGPAVAFLSAYIAMHPDQKIASMQFAIGGTGIFQWEPGGGGIYEGMAPRIRAALAANPDMELAGFVFYQGECDAHPNCNPVRTDDWSGSFSHLVRTFRSDFSVPDMPVVFAQIGSTDDPSLTFMSHVREEQRQAQIEIPHSQMITTLDLGRRDQIHLTDASYQTVGYRMQDAFENLHYPGCSDGLTILGMQVQ